MSEALSMSLQMTLLDTDSAISSPELADGRLPPVLLDGPTTGKSGPARRPASRSALRESSAAPMTSGTYGPTCFACSVPAGPLSSWESRLRQRLARIGSTECSLIWKESVTPAGRSLSRLVPSTRPIDEIDCGLWVTPSARDWKDSPGMTAQREDGRSRIDQLPRQVAAAMWSTPRASDGEKGGPNQSFGAGGQPLPAQAFHVAMWPTATVGDSRNSRNATASRSSEDSQHHAGWTLSDHAHAMALWPTPNASDEKWRYSQSEPAIRRIESGKQVSLECAVHGMAHRGSSATTEKPGALNPEFVCWLIGLPQSWIDCAPSKQEVSKR